MASGEGRHAGVGIGLRTGPLRYRRRIEVVPLGDVVEAAMEDYIHHFGVRLAHDGERITEATATGVRVPWTTCPVGAAGIAEIAGTPLAEATVVDRWLDDRASQCVHTVDLATVAAAHATDVAPLVYEIGVELAAFTERRAVLRRDGDVVLDWTVEGNDVVGGGPQAGMSLARAAFANWLTTRVVPDDREPFVVLRRACTIAMGRYMDLDTVAVAGDIHPGDDSCHTYRSEVAAIAARCRGTARETESDAPGSTIPGGPFERHGIGSP